MRKRKIVRKSKLKVFEFDTYLLGTGETPSKIGVDLIPARSLKEAKLFLRSIKTDEPTLQIYRKTSPLSRYEFDAQQELVESYKFLRKALAYYRKHKLKKWG